MCACVVFIKNLCGHKTTRQETTYILVQYASAIFTAVVRAATDVVYIRYPDRAAVRKGRPRWNQATATILQYDSSSVLYHDHQ